MSDFQSVSEEYFKTLQHLNELSTTLFEFSPQSLIFNGRDYPRTNISFDNITKKYIYEFSVPGFSKTDLELKIEDNMLLISGKKEIAPQNEVNTKGIADRSFRKKLALPKNVNLEKITKPVLQYGILRLELPVYETSLIKEQLLQIVDSQDPLPLEEILEIKNKLDPKVSVLDIPRPTKSSKFRSTIPTHPEKLFDAVIPRNTRNPNLSPPLPKSLDQLTETFLPFILPTQHNLLQAYRYRSYSKPFIGLISAPKDQNLWNILNVIEIYEESTALNSASNAIIQFAKSCDWCHVCDEEDRGNYYEMKLSNKVWLDQKLYLTKPTSFSDQKPYYWLTISAKLTPILLAKVENLLTSNKCQNLLLIGDKKDLTNNIANKLTMEYSIQNW